MKVEIDEQANFFAVQIGLARIGFAEKTEKAEENRILAAPIYDAVIGHSDWHRGLPRLLV